MRGFPNHPVPCELCGKPGFPSNRRCRSHQPPTSRLGIPSMPQRMPLCAPPGRARSGIAHGPADHRSGAAHQLSALHVSLRAQRLGIPFDTRHMWTAEEEQFLLNNAGRLTPRAMQRVLGHGWTKIESEIRQHGPAHCDPRGYDRPCHRDGAGPVAAHRPEVGTRWRSSARLAASRCDGRAFVEQHPEQYDLRKVDQDWFKALLFPSARCFTHIVTVDAAAWESMAAKRKDS